MLANYAECSVFVGIYLISQTLSKERKRLIQFLEAIKMRLT